ncbi:hypothetical protein H3C61_02080 [Candidatus Gracilibacteria bacterium]|nr:hypothetical protein [Candidatus Gracilibacteria bacterium]
MKKSFLLLIVMFFLTSCFGSSDTTSKIEGLTLYNGNGFDINTPSNWNIIEKNSNILPNPKDSTIELAVSSDELKYGFANNMLILSQNLDKIVSSTDFSILNNIGSSKEYKEYQKLESKGIEFISKEKSNLYVFEAKYNIDTPKFKYLQTGVVCKNKGYLITIALSSEIKDVSKYEEILKTFECK